MRLIVFLGYVVFALLLVPCVPAYLIAQTELPSTSTKPALQFEHFPSRAHAFVFRNWEIASVPRMAAVLKCSEDEVRAVANSLGLDSDIDVSQDFDSRGYITLLRRNWHLLPYDQLLTLLNLNASELAFRLREDDFLYIKLGNVKPQCEPIRLEELNASQVAQVARIKQLLKQHFGSFRARSEWEPSFQFVEHLSKNELAEKAADQKPSPEVVIDSTSPPTQVRYVYSYFGGYGDPLIDRTLDPFPDGLLQKLSDVGVNGVWLHVVLRQLAPGGEDFPEFGDDHELRLQRLNELVQRAKRFGISIYLYMNEPRAMPKSFFDNRPQLAGVTEGDFVTMCTSQPQVLEWVKQSLKHVFTAVPDLGGVFAITASENLTHCWSHAHGGACPRCGSRLEAEVIADVVSAIEAGVHAGNPKARVIAWDWGWNRHGDGSEVIKLLPDRIAVMSVSEWALPTQRGGVTQTVGEYSMSVVGPGPRATRHWQLARERGLDAFAKCQFNATWELAALPYIPVMDLVAQHCERLREQKVDGYQLCWTVGGYPSPNLRIAQLLSSTNTTTAEQVLDQLATDIAGPALAPPLRAAWTAWSQAFQEFPYSGQVVYNAPQQMGCANLLYLRPTTYSATMTGIPYDDLNGWRGEYPREVFVSQFRKLADGWNAATLTLQQATATTVNPQVIEQVQLGLAAGLHFQSVADQAEFILLRDRLAEATSADDKTALQKAMIEVVQRELQAAKRMYELARRDSRLGFEAANHYFYVPLDLVEKVISCEHIVATLESTEEQPNR